MDNMHSQLQAHLKLIDEQIPFKTFSSGSLQDWILCGY